MADRLRSRLDNPEADIAQIVADVEMKRRCLSWEAQSIRQEMSSFCLGAAADLAD